MGHKDIKGETGDYKGIKKIAARICIKLNAPLVRMLNQKVGMICRETEHISETLEKTMRQLEGYEGLAENVGNINRQLEGYEELIENVRNTNRQLEGYEKLVENVRNTNRQLEGCEKLAENMGDISRQLENDRALLGNISENLEGIAVNVRNNNTRLENIDSTMDMHGVKISGLQKTVLQNQAPVLQNQTPALQNQTPALQNQTPALQNQTPALQNQTPALHKDGADGMAGGKEKEPEAFPGGGASYGGIDYFDFENHFRGSREQIKKNQKIYIKYFLNRNHVLDLGCGRGEFLELLEENGIRGYGVDLYQEFVDLCTAKQLHAVRADAVAYLEQETEADGIFAGQLVEHLPLQQLVRLTEAAYEKLAAGAYLVLETPNPMSLAIYTNSFYMDPSHNKPVHPLTMKYLLEKAGFRDIDIIFTESSRPPGKIPALETEGAGNTADFNRAMREVEQMLYGSQDYAIIAKK